MRIHGVLSVKPDYTCRRCGIVQTGEVMRITVAENTAQDVAQAIERAARSAASREIPIGWSFTGVFHCPACTRARKEEWETQKGNQ